MIEPNVPHVLTPGLLEACDDEQLRNCLVQMYQEDREMDTTTVFSYDEGGVFATTISNAAIESSAFDLVRLAKIELTPEGLNDGR